MKGYLITFEGPDGAGKTTVINELIKQLPKEIQKKTIITREPGGSKISENIRTIILDPANKEMDDRTEALKEVSMLVKLFAQLWQLEKLSCQIDLLIVL